MIERLRAQGRMMEHGLKAGLVLGGGYIFLALIGLPSSDSVQLARLAVPLYLLLALWLGWRLAKRLNTAPPNVLTANLLSLGAGSAIVFLVFMGQINRWHAEDIKVTSRYFARMSPYPMQVFSGVPVAELYPQPPLDPLTGDYKDGARPRTEPMRLYTQADYALLSVAGLHVGGLYGFGLMVGLAALLGGLSQRAWRTAQMRLARPEASAWASTWRESLAHGGLLLLPAVFFGLFWLTVPQRTSLAVFEPLGVAGNKPLHVIPLRTSLNLSSQSLIDEPSIQLGLSFLMVISAVLALRRARPSTRAWGGYAGRAGAVLALMGALLALTVWRMEAHQITFISPSIPFGGLEAHSASLLVAILLIFGLTAYGLRAVRQAENFERVMVMLLSVSLVLMAPLYMDQYQSFVMGRVVLAAMLGMGLNLVIGYAGLLDLGYVAFYAIGAYTFAFLALENDRSKVSVDFINNLGWMLVTALIVAPLVIFGASLLWSKRPSPAPRPVVKGYRRHTPVWVGQPPALVSVGMVGLVILLTFGVKEALTQAGIFAVSQFSTFLIAMVVAMVAAAFTGFMLGLPVLRLRGDYLAIVTLGFGEIISLAMNNFDTVTGGPSGAIGVPKPLPAGTGLEITNLTMLYLTMAGVALIALLSLRLRDSRLGRAWFAMSSDEDIAQAMGVNLVNVKLLAFITGASFAGLAGMLFASRQNSIFPNDFGLEVSINALALVIIGGMGSIPGVIIGSIALIGLPELLRPVADYRIMAFGLLLILTTITLPRGLVPLRPPELEAQARAIKKEDSAP